MRIETVGFLLKIIFKISAKNKNTIEIYKKQKKMSKRRSKAKNRKDREQDKKLNKLMSLVDTSKKQADTFYQVFSFLF